MAVKTLFHKVDTKRALIKEIKKAAKENWFYLLISGVGDRIYWGELPGVTVLHQIELDPNLTPEITELPNEIGLCKKLKGLVIHKTKIKILPSEIGNLTNLQILDVFGNDVAELPNEISRLENLHTLDLRSNQIEAFPKGIDKLNKLKKLNIRNNPIPIPLEISRKINEPKAIFAYYFAVLVEKRQPIHEVKLIFVGQGSIMNPEN
jgi:internalin A